jgi:hypothetical protein
MNRLLIVEPSTNKDHEYINQITRGLFYWCYSCPRTEAAIRVDGFFIKPCHKITPLPVLINKGLQEWVDHTPRSGYELLKARFQLKPWHRPSKFLEVIDKTTKVEVIFWNPRKLKS